MGLPDAVFLLWLSALIYMISILFLLKTFLRENTKLLDAFFVYLEGMALMHVFLGMALFFPGAKEALFFLAFAGGIAGAAFSTRFLVYSELPKYEKKVFYAILLIGAFVLLYPASVGHISTLGLTWTMLYMIIFTGVTSSMYLVYVSDQQSDLSSKIKGVGGGIGMFLSSGVASTIIIFVGLSATVDVSGRAFSLPEFFMLLSPIVILVSILGGRYVDRVMEKEDMESVGEAVKR